MIVAQCSSNVSPSRQPGPAAAVMVGRMASRKLFMLSTLTMSVPKSKPIAPALLRWYDTHRRVMPWRAPAGVTPNPYYVWLSEIMLQQTTVATVGPYFKKFVTRWPTLKKLAAATEDEVLAAWSGLGYYSRARNLHKCAQVLVTEHNAQMPHDVASLLRLPGVGPYTSAAIAAIAFDQPANVVDSNVERVMARLFAVTTPLPQAKKELTAVAATLVPQKRAGDYAQALMDLGATVCTPKNPRCSSCPLVKSCSANAGGTPALYPRRMKKAKVPEKSTVAYVVTRGDKVLLRQRAATGLLARMSEVPNDGLVKKALAKLPMKIKARDWQTVPMPVDHVFSHFRLTLQVKIARLKPRPAPATALPAPYFWASIETLEQQALPTVMRKVLLAAGVMQGKRKP